MNKVSKFIIIIFCSILAMSLFASNAKCAVTIGNSTFHADEGDVYTWEMTYCHPALNASYGVGSYINLTIEDIGQGAYFSITHALLVNATLGYFRINANAHQVSYIQNYIVHNATQHYFYSPTFTLFIIPTPLNLTMICDFFETQGYTCTRDGKKVTAEFFDEIHTYKYNSIGHLIEYTFSEDNELGFVYGSNGSDGGSTISFGYYLLVFAIIGTLALIYLEKRKIK